MVQEVLYVILVLLLEKYISLHGMVLTIQLLHKLQIILEEIIKVFVLLQMVVELLLLDIMIIFIMQNGMELIMEH